MAKVKQVGAEQPSECPVACKQVRWDRQANPALENGAAVLAPFLEPDVIKHPCGAHTKS